MYKESMDGSTILFKGDYYSKAYDLKYLNTNYNSISSGLQDVKEIYYKCNSSRNSWIDYKNSLIFPEKKGLSASDRILTSNKYLSDDLSEIPETEYIDGLGYKYTIGARDGLDSPSSEKNLYRYLQANIKKKFSSYEYKTDDGVSHRTKKLRVEFKSDIRNSIITFNGIFEPYTIISDYVIEYYEDDGTNGTGVSFPRNDNGNLKSDWCYIIPYTWDDVYIQSTNETPIRREDDWLVFENEIDDGCVLFYNGIMCFYKVNPINECYVKITSIDIGNVNNFQLEDVRIIRLRNKEGDVIKQQRFSGFFNESEKIVYFPINVNNSLITYNGANHNYIIMPDNKSIKFVIPGDLQVDLNTNEELQDLDPDSKIFAVNFYTGQVPEPKYESPQTMVAEVANDVLNTYKTKLNKAQARVNYLEKSQDIIYDDYYDQVVFNSKRPNIFKLAYIPEENSLTMYINGVQYDNDLYFIYHGEEKGVEWTYTEFNGGFDLDANMDITIRYDFYYSVNNIPTSEISSFKEQLLSNQEALRKAYYENDGN